MNRIEAISKSTSHVNSQVGLKFQEGEDEENHV
jgi:hypothetical protein